MILRDLARVLLHKYALGRVSGFQMFRLALSDLIQFCETSETEAIFGVIGPDEKLFQREPDLSHQVGWDEE